MTYAEIMQALTRYPWHDILDRPDKITVSSGVLVYQDTGCHNLHIYCNGRWLPCTCCYTGIGD